MSEQKLNKDLNPDASSSNERVPESDAFYIGWQPGAPNSFAKHVKKVLMVLFPLVLVLGYLLSTSQKKFSTAVFEFGKLTEVTGVYFNKPVPMLKVTDKNNNSISIPLMGYGKHGAETAIEELETERGISFNNRMLTLRGTLLYGDGKVLMQIDRNEDPVVSTGEISEQQPENQELGTVTIRGEIVDPKCFFGVMKPGEGKVHRDCAIRCILGGIPPVLHVQNEKGESNFYFIAGPDGEKMNQAVQHVVAEPVSVEARAVQVDDWIVLYTSKENIRRIAYTQLKDPGSAVIACNTKCE